MSTICRETAVQQLAEHEKGIEGARSQIGPLQESVEQQLQAMKVSQSLVYLQGQSAMTAALV